jgi:hypothetical protein
MVRWLSLLPKNFKMQVGCFSAEFSLCSLPDQYAFFVSLENELPNLKKKGHEESTTFEKH